jgi:hypothetical protein
VSERGGENPWLVQPFDRASIAHVRWPWPNLRATLRKKIEANIT